MSCDFEQQKCAQYYELITKSLRKELIDTLDNTAPVEIIMKESLNIQDLENHGQNYNLQKIDLVYISGNYIYLPSNNKLAIDLPDRAFDSLIPAIVIANSTKIDIEGKSYHFNVIKEYSDKLEDDKNLGELESRLSSCSNPNKDQFSEISCIISLYFAGLGGNLTTNNYEFISNNLPNLGNLKSIALGLPDKATIDKYFDIVSTKESPVAYSNWEVDALEDINSEAMPLRLASESNYYLVSSESDLKSITEEIEKDGWAKFNRVETVNDSKFNLKQEMVAYSLEDLLLEKYLAVRIMDTSTMNADCIVGGVGLAYCNNQSLYKNSGYLVNIIIVFR